MNSLLLCCTFLESYGWFSWRIWFLGFTSCSRNSPTLHHPTFFWYVGVCLCVCERCLEHCNSTYNDAICLHLCTTLWFQMRVCIWSSKRLQHNKRDRWALLVSLCTCRRLQIQKHLLCCYYMMKVHTQGSLMIISFACRFFSWSRFFGFFLAV